MKMFLPGACAAIAISICHAQAAGFYQLIDLGTLGGTSSRAFALNNNGDVVGQASTTVGYLRAFRYRSGTMMDLGTLGGNRSAAYGINSDGDIVGAAETTFVDGSGYVVYHAFRYRTNMTDLGTVTPPPAGFSNSIAYGINDLGDIVGTALPQQLGFPPGDFQAKGWPWLYYNGSMISGPFGYAGRIYSINSNRQMVGRYFLDNSNVERAFRYEFPSFAFADIGQQAVARSINDSGQTAGYWTSGGAFIDLNGSKQSLWPMDVALGINRFGQAVGYKLTTNGQSRAYLYCGSRTFDLNALIQSNIPSAVVTVASAINDRGQIVGEATVSGNTHAVLLQPLNPLVCDLSRQTNTFTVAVIGTLGRTNSIQVSTNLTNWANVFMSTNAVGSFSDSNMNAYPYRFYRVLSE